MYGENSGCLISCGVELLILLKTQVILTTLRIIILSFNVINLRLNWVFSSEVSLRISDYLTPKKEVWELLITLAFESGTLRRKGRELLLNWGWIHTGKYFMFTIFKFFQKSFMETSTNFGILYSVSHPVGTKDQTDTLDFCTKKSASTLVGK